MFWRRVFEDSSLSRNWLGIELCKRNIMGLGFCVVYCWSRENFWFSGWLKCLWCDVWVVGFWIVMVMEYGRINYSCLILCESCFLVC